MFLTTRFCIFILFVCLAGCATRPPVDPLENIFEASTDLASQYDINSNWWTIYQDKQLDELMSIALRNNLDLAKSAIQISRALYQANLIGADLVPRFLASGSASSMKNTTSGEPSIRNFSAGADINYELDLWRRLADSASAEEWEHKATIADKAAVRLTLINSVIDTYFTLAYLDKSLAATTASIKNYERLLQVVSAKYRLGQVSRLELEQAAQAVLATKNNLIELENEQRIAVQTIRLLLNIGPTEPLNLVFADIVQIKTPNIDLDIPLSALAARPDLKAAEYRLQRAFKRLRAANKAWYPSITLGASLSASSESSSTVFDTPFAAGIIKINLPFLDWNRVYWNVKISEAEYDLLKIDFEEKINRALNEIDSAIFFYKKAQATYSNTSNKLEHDVRISAYYRRRYELGVSELSDWINAQNTVLESRQDLLRTRYLVIKHENSIYKMLTGQFTAKPAL